MILNSFTLSPVIKTKLIKIDSLFKEILVFPLSPKIENELRNQAIISRLEGWAILANQSLTKKELTEMLGLYQAKNNSPLIAKVLGYKNAINYVRENWTGNYLPVTYQTIYELFNILDVSLLPQESVEPILAQLNVKELHPVVQAGLVHLAFYPSRSSYLLSLLYLSKAGYDLRGWLSLESCWSQNKDSYLKVIQDATTSTNSTQWLEYFCEAVILQMTKVKSDISELTSIPHQNVSKYINKRQEGIIEFIQQSPVPVTNRQIQAEFNISQVTASRDLAKLSIAGLIATHGSGRSTSYTKI